MSSELLPRLVEVRKLASRAQVLKGRLEPSRFARLDSQGSRIVSELNVHAEFFVCERGRAGLSLRFSALAAMPCQRCLDSVELPLKIDSLLTVVADDEEARSLQRQIEPLILENGMLDLHSLVEDEILLALPIVPHHSDDSEQCFRFLNYAKTPEQLDEAAREGDREWGLPSGSDRVVRRSEVGETNAFAELESLKRGL